VSRLQMGNSSVTALLSALRSVLQQSPAYGAREALELLLCRAAVRAKYNRANGYEADCDVIYGDTDSVMVNFKVLIAA
jgi:DNA polymerase elongation subunit (family B)